jgi:ribosomal protein L29
MKKYKDVTTEELVKTMHDEENNVRSFDMKLAGGTTKNVKEKKNARKTIAKIMTELNARARA